VKGYIYLIGSKHFRWYKIGKSRTPNIRIKNIGVLLPFKIRIFGLWRVEDSSLAEATLHELYSKKNINGEWFLLKDEDVEALISKILPVDARIFPHEGSDTFLTDFHNIPHDFPPPMRLRADISEKEMELKKKLTALYRELAAAKHEIGRLKIFIKSHLPEHAIEVDNS
jgi:Meiotically up-regulated gene 113